MQTANVQISNDEQAIRELVEKWLTASRTADTETLMKLMADDVVFMVPGKEPFGKEEFLSSANSMDDLDLQANHQIKELKVLNDWAWMRSHLTISMRTPDGTRDVKSGYILTVLRKNQSGQWVIASDANLLTSKQQN